MSKINPLKNWLTLLQSFIDKKDCKAYFSFWSKEIRSISASKDSSNSAYWQKESNQEGLLWSKPPLSWLEKQVTNSTVVVRKWQSHTSEQVIVFPTTNKIRMQFGTSERRSNSATLSKSPLSPWNSSTAREYRPNFLRSISSANISPNRKVTFWNYQ